MQRKITDVFANLMGRGRGDQQRRNDADDAGDDGQESSEQSDGISQEQMDELRATTCAAYKNLYWTRLISREHHQAETRKSWPIGPDLADEFDLLFWVDEDELPEWRAQWDTAAFAQAHPELKIAQWRLSDERLRELAVQAIEIRQQIDEKAALYHRIDEVPLHNMATLIVVDGPPST